MIEWHTDSDSEFILTPIRNSFKACQPTHFILTKTCSDPTLDTWSPRHRLRIIFLINPAS